MKTINYTINKKILFLALLEKGLGFQLLCTRVLGQFCGWIQEAFNLLGFALQWCFALILVDALLCVVAATGLLKECHDGGKQKPECKDSFLKEKKRLQWTVGPTGRLNFELLLLL